MSADPWGAMVDFGPDRECKNGCGTCGWVQERNGQLCVFCEICGAFMFNAPKSLFGEGAPRKRRPNIPPSKRARVFDRHDGRCFICDRKGEHLGHLLSVKDCEDLDVEEDLIYSDDNLVPLCADCNLGWRERSLNPRLVYKALVIARQRTQFTNPSNSKGNSK